MRVSLQWLQELVPCPWPVALLAECLREVEDILALDKPLAGVVVGKLCGQQQHYYTLHTPWLGAPNQGLVGIA